MVGTRSKTISFLGLVATTLTAGAVQAQQGPASLPPSAQPAMEAILDAAMAELMTPGPKREDWNKGGADLYKLLAAAPGGTAANYILSVDKDGERTALIAGLEDPAKAAPPAWRVAARTGSAVGGGDAVDVTFGRLDGQSFFAGTQARQKVGEAFCSVGGMAGVRYVDPTTPAKSELPASMVDMMFALMVKRFEKQRICWRYDPDGDGYRVTHFLEDGQSLPALDAAGYRATIVAAAPIDRLLQKPASEK
jgi:hypothetical protein